MSNYSSGRLKKAKPSARRCDEHSLDLDRPANDQRDFHVYYSESQNASRSTQDVTFSNTHRSYHARTASGTSQSGSFIHPFHQPPSDAYPHGPYTPPIVTPSHQGSVVGSEYSISAVAGQDGDDQLRGNFRSHSTQSNYSTTPQPVLPSLRLQTKLIPSSQLGQGSQTNLSTSRNQRPSDLASPTETMSPCSGIRSSMDRGFRIRSRSDLDTYDQRESIRELRRKFDEKERIKEEKAAREEVRALEKQNLKEARQQERQHRKSNASETGRAKRSKSDLTVHTEKVDGFVSRDYNSVTPLPPPVTAEAETFVPPRRAQTGTRSATKKKTHSAWTSFVMWLRTRILRLGDSRKH